MATATYSKTKALQLEKMTREILSELPQIVSEFILALRDSTQPLTRYGYVRDIRTFLKYLQRENVSFAGKDLISFTAKDFEKLTAKDLNLYLDYLTLYFNDDDNMITNDELGKMRKFYSLRSFYKWMFRQQYVKSDVTALVITPKRHEKPIIRLDLEETEKMLNEAQSGEKLSAKQKVYHELTSLRDTAIVTLLLGTGIRVSECVGLNVTDINLENNSFLITRKGGNQTILYFPDEVANALKAYMEQRKEITPIPGHEEALFLSLQKRRITERSIENLVKKYAAIAAPLKNKISPHKLRSTFGTNLYNETGDIYLVADVLGHSDINTTRRHYAAINENRRKYAATKVVLHENSENDSQDSDK